MGTPDPDADGSRVPVAEICLLRRLARGLLRPAPDGIAAPSLEPAHVRAAARQLPAHPRQHAGAVHVWPPARAATGRAHVRAALRHFGAGWRGAEPDDAAVHRRWPDYPR